jgi:hypothetical protein
MEEGVGREKEGEKRERWGEMERINLARITRGILSHAKVKRDVCLID